MSTTNIRSKRPSEKAGDHHNIAASQVAPYISRMCIEEAAIVARVPKGIIRKAVLGKLKNSPTLPTTQTSDRDYRIRTDLLFDWVKSCSDEGTVKVSPESLARLERIAKGAIKHAIVSAECDERLFGTMSRIMAENQKQKQRAWVDPHDAAA